MATDPEIQPLLASMDTNTQEQAFVSRITSRDNKISPDTKWQPELKLIFQYATPLIGTYLLQYFYQLIIVLVSSRLSTEELAAVSLGITTSNIIGYAIFEGMATSLDTLCAQAYGSSKLPLVGLHTARFTIFIHLVALPIGVSWLFSPKILTHLVPSPSLATSAGKFLRYSLIGVPGYATFEAGKRFMQAQGNFTASLIVLLICAPINILLNYILVFHFALRIPGAALAAALTNLLRPILLVLYAIFIAPDTLQCWPSPLKLRLVFANWGPMVSLAIPGALMTLSEWFAFEILTFSTSYVTTAQLAAQTFLSTSSVLIWHIPFSVSVAISTRIGQLVGGGFVDAARKVTRWYVYIFVVIGVLDMGLLVILNKLITKDLATDDIVRDLVAGAMPFVAIFQFFDSTSSWIHGVIRGLGWQDIGGWTTVTVNYLYAVPLALFLELGSPALGIRGIWIALGSGLAVITIAEGLVTKVRNWDRCLEEADRREES